MAKSFKFLSYLAAIIGFPIIIGDFTNLQKGITCVIVWSLCWLSGYYAGAEEKEKQRHIEELQTRIRH